MIAPTSYRGLLSLLQDPTTAHFALEKCAINVHVGWMEMAQELETIEGLYEQKQNETAAILASKIYYHLGEDQEALAYALKAGKLFQPEEESEYALWIVSKCINLYIEQRTSSPLKIDTRLSDVIEQIFTNSIKAHEYKQTIGIALEARRLDIIERTLSNLSDEVRRNLLRYTLDVGLQFQTNVAFRNDMLQLLVKLYLSLAKPDYISISECLIILDQPAELAKIFIELSSKNTEDSILLAYQIAFDTSENATQEFLTKLLSSLPWSATPSAASTEPGYMDVDAPTQPNGAAPVETTATVPQRICEILSGVTTVKLYLQFLARNNKADSLLLKQTKTSLDARLSMHHSAVTFANGFMHSGTSYDTFLRENMEWLSRATNWAKFSATSALGSLHQGQLSNARSLLETYLPSEGVMGSSYSEGGALYALGLVVAGYGNVNAGKGESGIDYLRRMLLASSVDVVQSGGCLGLGLAGMGSRRDDIYDDLKNVLFSDSAVAGEAAGLAMGLIMLGTGNDNAVDEMLQYAHETQHDKIIRGLAVGVALIAYGREEGADTIIERLLSDKDAILRYGGVFAVSLAYAGTGSDIAIKRLLNVAVSDVSDDVRRVAVIGLGFILFRTPAQVPKVVELLSSSYNPHVRYGACMALGISCSGTSNTEALNIIETMVSDPVDYVRQGAFVSAAMILMQHNPATSTQAASYRERYKKIISTQHEEALSKLGAVIAQGIIDAGGRNCVISLQGSNGHKNMNSIVGMVLYLQSWYWFPLSHALSLSFTPTGFMGLNKDLEVPKFEVMCNKPASAFAYPEETKVASTAKIEKVETAVLSTTAKAKARRRKRDTVPKDGMDTDPSPADASKDVKMSEDASAPKAGEKPADTPAAASPPVVSEPATHLVENFSRVTLMQGEFMTFQKDSRFVPVKPDARSGIVLLRDTKSSGEKAEILELKVPGVTPEKTPAPAPASAASGAASTTTAPAAPATGSTTAPAAST